MAKLRSDYAKDGERIREANRKYYWRNRERRLESYKNWRAANLEGVQKRERDRSRLRYATDPAGWQAYLKEWRRRNPERAHAYVRAATFKRKQASAGQSFTAEEWLALLDWHGKKCAYCGDATLIEIDHRIPLVRGGSNLIENILPACRRCNRRKNRMTEEEFRALLQAQRAQGLEFGDASGRLNAGTMRS